MANFSFPNQTAFFKGKVRDVYTISNDILVMIVSNRISAFDVILPKEIPYKGQVLNQIATYMLKETEDICPNWLITVPAPNVSIGKLCIPFKIEVVVRGNLTGHAWRVYSNGGRKLCGINLPDDMKENDFFPIPIITPTTKAAEGHDADISETEILEDGLASEAEWIEIKQLALNLFKRGKEIAEKQGLILADTKYEFGKRDNQIYLMDEIHTPDSSRYFYSNGFEENQANGIKQKQLSKEFVREWLISRNFMGRTNDTLPKISDEFVKNTSERYIELYKRITGKAFIPDVLSDENLQAKIITGLKNLK